MKSAFIEQARQQQLCVKEKPTAREAKATQLTVAAEKPTEKNFREGVLQ
jgi:hypothetical protein